MAVTVTLGPDIERKLREKAAKVGQSPEVYAARLVEKDVATTQGKTNVEEIKPSATVEERIAALRAWVASHKWTGVIAGDSHESIYEGRGE